MLALDRCEPARTVGGFRNHAQIVGGGEGRAQAGARERVIFDQDDPSRFAQIATVARTRGKVKVNLLPPPAAGAYAIEPPWLSAMRRTTYNPSPEPAPGRAAAFVKRWKSRARSSSGT